MMLLNHAGMALSCLCVVVDSWLTRSKAGLEYTLFIDTVRLYGQPAGIDELDCRPSGILGQPLTFEPGHSTTSP